MLVHMKLQCLLCGKLLVAYRAWSTVLAVTINGDAFLLLESGVGILPCARFHIICTQPWRVSANMIGIVLKACSSLVMAAICAAKCFFQMGIMCSESAI